MITKCVFILALCFTGTLLCANDAIIGEDSPEELVIYNRILGKVNGKTISVLDVMKRMDLFLQKHYPQFFRSKVARYQFYSSHWREYLDQMIDTELMLADSEKLELKVSEAEVREEILNRFGPNIMPTLDELGLTYEETRKMIHDEMIVQRIIWFRVNSKALHNVNSRDVKQAYEQYRIDNPEMQEWHYQVLSIRSPNKNASELLATRAFELMNSHLNLDTVAQELTSPQETPGISVSQEIHANEKSISSSHKEVLQTLSQNTFSKPIAQISRVDNSVVYRIFHLKKSSKTKVLSFTQMADQLKEQLLQEEATKQSSQYILKLRERLSYDAKQMMENLPSDFQPFAMR